MLASWFVKAKWAGGHFPQAKKNKKTPTFYKCALNLKICMASVTIIASFNEGFICRCFMQHYRLKMNRNEQVLCKVKTVIQLLTT